MPTNLANPFVIEPPAGFLEKHPHLRGLASQLSVAYVQHFRVDEKMLKAVGTAFWEALGLGDEFEEAGKSAGLKILPLVIRTEDPELIALPWETIHHPDFGFLARDQRFAFSRQIGSAEVDHTLEKGPLRALLFTSLPDDVDAEKSRLDVEIEQENILEALDPAIRAGKIILEVPDDGTFRAFADRASESDSPHLIFLSGHGIFKDRSAEGKTSEAYFLFEDEEGGSDKKSAGEIAASLHGGSLQCMVLSACQSGRLIPSEELTAGLATHLSLAGVSHVIGMRESVLDVAATAFAREFAEQIAAEQPVTVAVQRGRDAMVKPQDDDQRRYQEPRRDDRDEPLAPEFDQSQWSLPALYSRDLALPLVDWKFTPQPPVQRLLAKESLAGILQPPRFIGRRMELRHLGRLLESGEIRHLLITAIGGQGKTSLAGRLARGFEKRGYRVFAFAANQHEDSAAFVSGLKQVLTKEQNAEIDAKWATLDSDEERLGLIVRALLDSHDGKVLLFLDNLESIQDEKTRELRDPQLRALLAACRSLGQDSPIVLATSRWVIPAWEGERIHHHALRRPSYGDFIRYTRDLISGSVNRKRMRQLYSGLGGSFKGLEILLGDKVLALDDDLLTRLESAKDELKVFTAIEETCARLGETERSLLARLRAYRTPVIEDGIWVLCTDLEDPQDALSQLIAFSLIDLELDFSLELFRYSLAPIVADWLEKTTGPIEKELIEKAARYQLWSFHHLSTTLAQALVTHEALAQAEMQDEADRFALDWIVGVLSNAGRYRELIDLWLPPIQNSPHASMRGEAMGQTGMILHHLGQYDLALEFHQQSLTLQREIGDRKSEGISLNNISQIHRVRGEYDFALEFLHESLTIRRETGDRRGEGVTLNNISQIHKARGDYIFALKFLQRSLTIQREIGDLKGESTTLSNISSIHKAQGEYDLALELSQQDLAICRKIGDRKGEGTTLNNISTIHQARGEHDLALEYLQQSLSIQREIGDRNGEGNTLNNISSIYQARGDYDLSLEFFQQSLSIQREVGDRRGEGTVLNNISGIYHTRGEHTLALDFLHQSLAIRREIGDRSGLCATLFNIGHIHWQAKEQREAMDAWISVYRIAKELGEADALQALDGLAKQMGQDGLILWETLAEQKEREGEEEDGD